MPRAAEWSTSAHMATGPSPTETYPYPPPNGAPAIDPSLESAGYDFQQQPSSAPAAVVAHPHFGASTSSASPSLDDSPHLVQTASSSSDTFYTPVGGQDPYASANGHTADDVSLPLGQAHGGSSSSSSAAAAAAAFGAPADPYTTGMSNMNGGMNGAASSHGYGSASTGMVAPPPPGTSHSAAAAMAGSNAYYQQTPAHMLHRASISGPVMNHHHYAQATAAAGTNPAQQQQSHVTAAGANPTATGVPAPPQAGDFAAWGTPSGSARPHTADGMFANHFGAFPSSQWTGSMPDYQRGARASFSSVSSVSDGMTPSSSGKIFSYMAGRDDGQSSNGGSGGGHGHKKRPRRRYDEIERLYPCSHPGCAKSYGTLNHLNAHVAMQKHGPKRTPAEFKEMRKAWRKAKREEEQRRTVSHPGASEDPMARAKMSMAYAQPGAANMGYTMAGYGSALGGAGGMQVPRYSVHAHQAAAHAAATAEGMYAHPGAAAAAAAPPTYATTDPALRSYSSSGTQQVQPTTSQPTGLGAYLMGHRGSI